MQNYGCCYIVVELSQLNYRKKFYIFLCSAWLEKLQRSQEQKLEESRLLEVVDNFYVNIYHQDTVKLQIADITFTQWPKNSIFALQG